MEKEKVSARRFELVKEIVGGYVKNCGSNFGCKYDYATERYVVDDGVLDIYVERAIHIADVTLNKLKDCEMMSREQMREDLLERKKVWDNITELAKNK